MPRSVEGVVKIYYIKSLVTMGFSCVIIRIVMILVSLVQFICSLHYNNNNPKFYYL